MPDNEQQTPDSKIIRDNLEIILKAAQDDYEQITYKRRNLQHNILRNYLWLATALFGAQIALFLNLTGAEHSLPWPVAPGFWFYFFASCMVIFSGGAFTFGIYAMMGRNMIMPYGSDYDSLFYTAMEEFEHKAAAGSLLLKMIKSLKEAILLHQKIAAVTGKSLRGIAVALLISIGMTVLAIISAFIKF